MTETSPTGGGAGGGAALATTQAKREENRDADSDIPQGEDRGSKVEIAGGPPPADYAAPEETREPTGLQAEEALMGPNGSIELNMVPTPGGPVPVGAIANSPEDAERILEERRETIERELKNRADRKLTDEEIDSIDGATLRAVAQQRGYKDVPLNGNHTSREFFKTAQAKDERYASKSRAKSTAS